MDEARFRLQRKLSILYNNYLSHSQEIGNDFYFFLDIMREIKIL